MPERREPKSETRVVVMKPLKWGRSEGGAVVQTRTKQAENGVMAREG